jgi:hypothetical protein
MTSSPEIPDAAFWARYFPAPVAGDDTVYWDACPTADDLRLTGWQERDRAGQAWFWVVWWRGRHAVHGWADDAPAATAAASTTTTGPLTHHPGPAAAYLGSWATG